MSEESTTPGAAGLTGSMFRATNRDRDTDPLVGFFAPSE
jgi:hypothetical protein